MLQLGTLQGVLKTVIFGFYNGANYQENYAPTVTRYDYDSPIVKINFNLIDRRILSSD